MYVDTTSEGCMLAIFLNVCHSGELSSAEMLAYVGNNYGKL